MKEETIKLCNRIWATRMSRINAEKRLLNNENFIQGLNIYYSLMTVIMSIFALVWPSQLLNVLTLIMTVSLLVVILYFKSLRFPERAMEYRRIYAEMQKLELKLKYSGDNEDTVKQVVDEYNELIKQGENQISFDYYKVLKECDKEYRETHWRKTFGREYWKYIIMRFTIRSIAIVLPIIMFGIWLVSICGKISI